MADRPIIFSAEMVRALLDGRKTQTRRVLKPQPRIRPELYESFDGKEKFWCVFNGDEIAGRVNVRYAPGDRLWVKHAADLFPVYFKPIPGWERLYAAGTDGVIYRIDGCEPAALSGCPQSRGYLTVSLSNGDWHTKAVHKLICETFYGPPPSEDAQVRHLDGNKLNNAPANLDWGTQEQNWQDRKAHGRGMGISHHAAKLTDEDVDQIRSSSLSQRALASRYGIAQSSVWAIRANQYRVRNHKPASRNMEAFALWRSPIFCPRWASRLTLIVESVKVERLRDISEADAEREGCALTAEQFALNDELRQRPKAVHGDAWHLKSARGNFIETWCAIHGGIDAWDANPWVAAISFRVIKANIDSDEVREG